MADVNAGAVLRFENGARFIIGTGGGAKNVLNIKPGSVKESGGGCTPIVVKDRGRRKKPIKGDENGCQIEGTVYYTAEIGVEDLLDLLRGELDEDGKLNNFTETGEIFTFTLTIEQPDAPGMDPAEETGQRRVYEECYLENPLDIQASAGEDVDTLQLKIMTVGPSPKWTRYEPAP